MIPLRLKLHNFMCYRDNVPPLHFESIHIACLSGDNGSGKSALIDAMTWALWGQARTRSDDDLVYSGQAEMVVTFDFTVGSQTYRIIRKRSRPKRRGSAGQSALEFQLASGNGFRPITGNSIAQTQQKISDELRMDYDTFINSAYLRQGHADEFTIKRPAERKEVLANILGLSFYDKLEEQTKALAQQQETDRTPLESAIRDIEAELTQKPTYDAEFEEARRALSQLKEKTKGKESGLNKLRQEKESLGKKKAQLKQLEISLVGHQNSLKVMEEQAGQHHSRIKECEKLITRRTDIEAGYARFSQAQKLNYELERKSRQSANLERQKSQLESTLNEASQSLVREHAVAQNQVGKLKDDAQRLPQLKTQLQQLQAQLVQLAEQEEMLRRKKQAGQELQAHVNFLESSQAQLAREIEETAGKIALLSTQTEAKCPLCERELEAGGLKIIESKYTAEKLNRAESLKSNQTELVQRKTEFEALEREISLLETQRIQQKIETQSQAGSCRQEITRAEEAARQLAEEKNRLAEIEQHLAQKDFARSEQAALNELESELAGLGYDSVQHDQVWNEFRDLEQYEKTNRELELAELDLVREKELATELSNATGELRHAADVDHQQRQALAAELNRLPQVIGEITRVETEQSALEAQQGKAQEKLGSAKANLQRLAEQEVKKKEKKDMLLQASREESIYKELAKAFGKEGIPALLIEIALPEIEVEANRLLGRMTDNRMHVKFETQRESKKGDTIETLDINISDELDLRNYENFSGGEAFRINFAIRIALSRLLARRAGAPLSILIIDEGFGTQDSTGIEKLRETINSIQEDFDKILVITHIEELRDAFPSHIDVIKTTEGSTLSVS